jgi:predicted amidophosphoribosyltransferase
MSAGLWMLVCVLLPGGIGAVVYFMLRQPILSRCPNCSTTIAATYNFCPQCQFQMFPVCGVCHRGVKITEAFCTQCGHDLAVDGAPARLRVYSD